MDSTQPSGDDFKRKKVAKRTKVALWLLIAPTLFAVAALILFSIVNLIFNPTFWMKPDTELITATPLGIMIVNVILFSIGVVGALAWLPGIIIGAILLIKRPSQPRK